MVHLWVNNYFGPGGVIHGNLIHGKAYKIMIPSKRVCTHHNICKFLCRSLVLKIHPNSGKIPGNTYEGEKKMCISPKGRSYD